MQTLSSYSSTVRQNTSTFRNESPRLRRNSLIVNQTYIHSEIEFYIQYYLALFINPNNYSFFTQPLIEKIGRKLQILKLTTKSGRVQIQAQLDKLGDESKKIKAISFLKQDPCNQVRVIYSSIQTTYRNITLLIGTQEKFPIVIEDKSRTKNGFRNVQLSTQAQGNDLSTNIAHFNQIASATISNPNIIFKGSCSAFSKQQLQHQQQDLTENPHVLLKKATIQKIQMPERISLEQYKKPKEISVLNSKSRQLTNSSNQQQLSSCQSNPRIKIISSSTSTLTEGSLGIPAGPKAKQKSTQKKLKRIVNDGGFFDSEVNCMSQDGIIEAPKNSCIQIDSKSLTNRKNGQTPRKWGSPQLKIEDGNKITKQNLQKRMKSPMQPSRTQRNGHSISRSTTPSRRVEESSSVLMTSTSRINLPNSRKPESVNGNQQSDSTPQIIKGFENHGSARNKKDQTSKKLSFNNSTLISLANETDEVRFERMARLKLLIDQNIKKSIQEKQAKLEEKEIEDRQKQEKKDQIAQKNQEIRNDNAFRFSRQKATSADLSRRLPWGINQEKLRNYAIQVLTSYRNSDIKHQIERQQKKSIDEMLQTFQIEEKARRQKIGLDNLPDSEIQRLLSIEKEKKRESLEGNISKYLVSPTQSNHGSILKRKEDQVIKRREIHHYMQTKKDQIEQSEIQYRLEEITEKSRLKSNQEELQATVKSILKRLKKKRRLRSSKSPSTYSLHDTTNALRLTQSPSSSFLQLQPHIQGKNINQIQPQPFNQMNNRSNTNLRTSATSKSIQTPHIPDQFHSITRSTMNGRPGQNSLTNSVQSLPYSKSTFGTEVHEMTEENNGDYSKLYDEFKNLISVQGETDIDLDYVQHSQSLISQQNSRFFQTPSFYNSPQVHGTQHSQQSSVTERKNPQPTIKLKKPKKPKSRQASPNQFHQTQTINFELNQNLLFQDQIIVNAQPHNPDKQLFQNPIIQQSYNQPHNDVKQVGMNQIAINAQSGIILTNPIKLAFQKYDNLLKRLSQIKQGVNSSQNGDSLISENLKQVRKQQEDAQSIKQNSNNKRSPPQPKTEQDIIQFDSSTATNTNQQIQHKIQQNGISEKSQTPQKNQFVSDYQIHNENSSDNAPPARPSPKILFEFQEEPNQNQQQFRSHNIYDNDEIELFNPAEIDQNVDKLEEPQQQRILSLNNQRTVQSIVDQEDNEEVNQEQQQQQQVITPDNQSTSKEEFHPISENNFEEFEDNGEQYNEEEMQEFAFQFYSNAATYIQKIWRGYFTRKILDQYLQMIEQGQFNEEGELIQPLQSTNAMVENTQDQDIPEKVINSNTTSNHKKQREVDVMRDDDDDDAQILQGSPEPKVNQISSENSAQLVNANQGTQINKEWYNNQEKEELRFHLEKNDSEDRFQFEESADERFVHISTIKSSIVSNEEGNQIRIDNNSGVYSNQYNIQQGFQEEQNSNTQQTQEEGDNFCQEDMTEEDLQNWIAVQQKVIQIRNSGSDIQRDQIVEILLDLNLQNQNRLLACLNISNDDDVNFSIEQIEAIFQIPFQQSNINMQVENQKNDSELPIQNPEKQQANEAINSHIPSLQIDIAAIGEFQKHSKLKEQENHIFIDSSQRDVEHKDSSRLSITSKRNLKEKSHSFNYETQSERSFNQMRRNKFQSPKDYKQGIRSSASFQSVNDNRSLDAVSPKEELNQLYVLLQQEQMMSIKKSNQNQSGSFSSKACSQKGSARNLKKDLQTDILTEYYDLAANTPCQDSQFNSAQKNPTNQIGSPNTLMTSIFENDTFKEFNEKKLQQIISQENIDQLLQMREKAIEFRKKHEMDVINQMLSENRVSPRTYDSQKIKVESWVEKEKEEMIHTRKAVERVILKAMESIQKTQRDVQLATRFKQNPGSNKDSQLGYLVSDDEYQLRQRNDHEGDHSYSDIHSEDPNSQQALKDLLKQISTPQSEGNIKIIDRFELHEVKKSKRRVSDTPPSISDKKTHKHLPIKTKGSIKSTQLFLEDKKDEASSKAHASSTESNQAVINENSTHDPLASFNKKAQNQQEMKLVLEYNDIDSSKGHTIQTALPLVTFPFSPIETIPVLDLQAKVLFDSKEIVQSEDEDSSDIGISKATELDRPNFEDSPEIYPKKSQLDSENSSHGQTQEKQVAIQQLSSPTAEFMERSEVLAEMQGKWRVFNQIDLRITEQLHKEISLDKSGQFGIPTNTKIIIDYLNNIFNYVVENYRDEFTSNLNTPFGFAPSKRLKLIHGYDSFVDSSCSEELKNNSIEDYSTLPFVLSEDLFIEFEQNIIGNGETEKEQIIKEFEHIHNKAIFDTFNEALNIFRPFYALGGPPYSWTMSEKNLVLWTATPNNLMQILQKSQKRVVEWSSYLCGLVNEDELPISLPAHDENGNPPPLSLLLEHLTPTNEYLASIREERLSKMLLTEIFENEFKWQLYEDEKTEVVMELSDLVFEHLVEELVFVLGELSLN